MTKPPPLPTPDEDSAPFWTAVRDGRLSAQRCPNCSRFRWPPMAFCPHCHTPGGEWVTLPGTGTVRSFVIARRAFDPAFDDNVPYIVAHVALDGADGVTIIANIVAEPVEAVSIGRRVAAEFVDLGTMTLPRFRTADAPHDEVR